MADDQRPDFLGLVRARLSEQAPLRAVHDTGEFGRTVLRQLGPAWAPGGAQRVRGSSVGSCARQIAYKYWQVPPDPEGRDRDARTAATFAVGDMVELLLLAALREALEREDLCERFGCTGWRFTGARGAGGQDKVVLQLEVPGAQLVQQPDGSMAPTLEIPGHPDGLLIAPDGRVVLLEIKSLSSGAQFFWERNLREHGQLLMAGDSYWWQVQTYIHATDAVAGYVLGIVKDNGVTLGSWVARNRDFPQWLSAHLEPAIDGTLTEFVPRRLPDGTVLGPVTDLHKTRGTPNKGHGALPWQCSYCAWPRRCWGEDLRIGVEKRRGKPTRVLRLRPDLPIEGGGTT